VRGITDSLDLFFRRKTLQGRSIFIMSLTFSQVPGRIIVRSTSEPTTITPEEPRHVEARYLDGVPLADGYVSQIPPNAIPFVSRRLFLEQIIEANEKAHQEAEQKIIQNKVNKAYEEDGVNLDEDDLFSDGSVSEEKFEEEVWNTFAAPDRPQYLNEIAKLWTYFLLKSPENSANKGARRHLFKLFLSLRQQLERGHEEDAKEGGKFCAIFNSALKAERRGRALDKKGLQDLKDFAARHFNPSELCNSIEETRKKLVFVNKCIELLTPKNRVSFAPDTKPGRAGKVTKAIKQEIDEGLEDYHNESLRRSPRRFH
jgi:hypothetical protein